MSVVIKVNDSKVDADRRHTPVTNVLDNRLVLKKRSQNVIDEEIACTSTPPS